jgi:hypothetical protein
VFHSPTPEPNIYPGGTDWTGAKTGSARQAAKPLSVPINLGEDVVGDGRTDTTIRQGKARFRDFAECPEGLGARNGISMPTMLVSVAKLKSHQSNRSPG